MALFKSATRLFKPIAFVLFLISLMILSQIQLSSCNSEPKTNYRFVSKSADVQKESTAVLQKLNGTELKLSQDILSAGKIRIYDNYLFIDTEEYESNLQKFTLNGEFVTSFFPKGSGPGELLSIVNFEAKQQDGKWQYFAGDIIQNKITTILEDQITDIKFEDRLTNYLSISDKYTIGVPLMADKLYGIYDREGKVVKTFGTFPPNEISNSPFVLSQAYTGSYGYNADKDIFVAALLYTDHLMIFSNVSSSEELTEVRGPLFYDPIFTVTQMRGMDMFAQDEKGRFSYIDMVLTKDHIICLFSGFSREELPSDANNGNIIFVFDYQGNVKKSFQVEEKLFSIAYHEDSQTLYGIDVVSSSNETIYKYPLKL